MERCHKRVEDCPARLSGEGCRVVSHHLFWPRQIYEDAGEMPSTFRELNTNRVPMCRGREMLLHQTTEPPPMPSMAVMRHVVETQRLRHELSARPLRRQ